MTAASPAAVTAPANPSCAHWSTAPAAARSTETIVPGTSTPPIDATTNSTPRHNAAPRALASTARNTAPEAAAAVAVTSAIPRRIWDRITPELPRAPFNARRPRERPQPAPRLRRQPANSRANQLLRPRHAW